MSHDQELARETDAFVDWLLYNRIRASLYPCTSGSFQYHLLTDSCTHLMKISSFFSLGVSHASSKFKSYLRDRNKI